MHRLISAVLVGTLVPFGMDVSALPQAAPAVQKPQAAETQAPVTAEQVRAAIDKPVIDMRSGVSWSIVIDTRLSCARFLTF